MRNTAIVFAAIFAFAPAAFAGPVPQAVQDACKKDYEKLCIKHEPESDAARDCMAQAFEKLSDGCVTAILDSSLVDEQKAKVEEAAKAPQAGEPAPSGAKTKVSQAPAPKAVEAQPARAATAKPKDRIAHAAASSHAVAPKTAKHTADAKPSKRAAKTAAKTQVAHRSTGGASRRSVAGYVQRGTSIANYYVAKYTRFAFSRGFR